MSEAAAEEAASEALEARKCATRAGVAESSRQVGDDGCAAAAATAVAMAAGWGGGSCACGGWAPGGGPVADMRETSGDPRSRSRERRDTEDLSAASWSSMWDAWVPLLGHRCAESDTDVLGDGTPEERFGEGGTRWRSIGDGAAAPATRDCGGSDVRLGEDERREYDLLLPVLRAGVGGGLSSTDPTNELLADSARERGDARGECDPDEVEGLTSRRRDCAGGKDGVREPECVLS